MTSADVRARLTHALRLDLIGPQPDEPQIAETLPIPPSRWYLTGFLVPWNAPVAQKADEDQQDDFGLTAPGANAGDDDTGTDPPAARRSQFPSSIGVSVLVAPDTKELTVAARWGRLRACSAGRQAHGRVEADRTSRNSDGEGRRRTQRSNFKGPAQR